MSDGFRMDAEGNLRAESLEEFAWLRHGFGTRAGVLPALPMATVKQIHSAEIRVVEQAGLAGEADALATQTLGLALGIKTADCVPILLVDARRRVVAAAHAGWRGTAARVAALTVERMTADFGSEPGDIRAAIGPAIGSCCYEVGPEVARALGMPVAAQQHVDLEMVNFGQLLAAGVPAGHIARARACTKCNSDRFFSFRNEGEKAGRMWSWIAVDEAGGE